LFPVGSATELARVVAELLDDPAQCAAMTARGARVVAPYDWDEVSRRVLEVYHLAIEAAPRQRREPDPREPRQRADDPAQPARPRWLPSRRG
jgi:hypothetical protein